MSPLALASSGTTSMKARSRSPSPGPTSTSEHWVARVCVLLDLCLFHHAAVFDVAHLLQKLCHLCLLLCVRRIRNLIDDIDVS